MAFDERKWREEHRKKAQEKLKELSNAGLPEGKGISVLQKMAEQRVLERYRHESKFYRRVHKEYCQLLNDLKEAMESEDVCL
jgi:hypothetical protein